jgi:hypothetical protein
MRSVTMGALARFVRHLRYGRPIVVVSGLPRSGTSMMMQMLQAGGLEILTDAVRTADGSNPKGYFEFEAVKDLDKGRPPAWLADARGKAVKIVSSLLRWLPDSHDYQVIFMQRDLDEVIRSQNKMLVDRGSPPDEAQNDRVKQAYRTHVEDTLRLLRGRRSVSMLVVDYSETLARPADTARQIDRFLQGRLDVDRMAAAADPDLYRNRSTTG